MRNGKTNPKNYPFWESVVAQLKNFGYYIIQISKDNNEKTINGIDEKQVNLDFNSLKNLVLSCDLWISVDNFFPHFCSHLDKRGVVIFGKSDPRLFGYEQNINIFKKIEYLRKYQFDIWESEEFDANVFVEPEIIISEVNKYLRSRERESPRL